MNLEFQVYELKEDSKEYKRLVQNSKSINEFIIVGEALVGKELDCFKAHRLTDEGLQLINGLDINESAYLVKKDLLKLKSEGIGYIVTNINIPQMYLTMEIIEEIQRLNE